MINKLGRAIWDKSKGLNRIFLEVKKPMKMKANTSC